MITIKPFNQWTIWAWVSGVVALSLFLLGTTRIFNGGDLLWGLFDIALAGLNGYFFYQDVKVDNQSNGRNS